MAQKGVCRYAGGGCGHHFKRATARPQVTPRLLFFSPVHYHPACTMPKRHSPLRPPPPLQGTPLVGEPQLPTTFAATGI